MNSTKLRGPSDWDSWLLGTRIHVHLLGLLDHLDHPEKRPAQGTERTDWDMYDLMIRLDLVKSLSDDLAQKLYQSGWNVRKPAFKTLDAIKKLTLKTSEPQPLATTK